MSHPRHIHYTTISSGIDDISQLEEIAKRINTMPWSSINITSNKAPTQYTGYIDITKALKNFTCDRCGEAFGAVTSWKPDRALVLDSLSGLNEIILSAVTGDSIARTQPQWGAAQTQEASIIGLLIRMKAHFVCIAHLSKTVDATGVPLIATEAIGNKPGPTIPRHFDEVYNPFRQGTGFFWDAASPRVATRSRLFAVTKNVTKIPQDFKTVMNRWRKIGCRGVNFLLHGDSGTGKSYSIGSFLGSGVEPFVILTETSELTYHLFDTAGD